MLRIAIILMFGVMALCSNAQTDTITSGTHILDSVIITETAKMKSMRSTSPQYILQHGQLQSMGVSTIAETLRRMPGVSLHDYGGAGGMKTVSVRGFGTQHTGVSYDGVMLSNVQTGDIDLSRYSLSYISQLKLTIGDDDNIFIPARQASTPAVLSIETMSDRYTDSSPHFDAQLSLGSFLYINPSIKYQQQVLQTLRLSAVVDYVSAKNNYPYTLHNVSLITHHHRENSAMQGGHIQCGMAWMPHPNHLLKSKIYYYNNHQQLPGIVRYYANVSSETLRNKNSFVQTQYLGRINARCYLKIIGKWDVANTSYRESNTHSSAMDADYCQHEVYTSLCFLYQPSQQWKLSYAADYIHHSLQSSLSTDIQPYRHSVLQNLATQYKTHGLTAVARLLGSLYINGAHAGTAANNQRQLSPSLSLSWAPLSHQTMFVRASYKNIFRMPTFHENYFFRYGSKDLKPEQTNQLNVGITIQKHLSNANIWATLDGYLNHVKDKIVAVPYNLFVWRTMNVGKVRMIGVDAMLCSTLQLKGQHTLTWMSNYSYQRAVNRTLPTSPYYNNQIAYVPLHTGSCSLNSRNPWVNLTLQWVSVGGRWLNNQHHENSYLQGYQEWSVTAYRTFRLGEQTLLLRADIKNIFNEQYQIIAGYPMPGIHGEITINYKI